jgi:hypothetical protein
MGVRRILTGALTAPLLLLSACGGDDSVADPPISSAPTSSKATFPAKRESAEHFIRRWAAADIQMQNTGETAPFREMSDHCHDCLDLANRVDSIYRAGGYIHTEGWSVGKVAIVSQTGARLLINMHVVSKPTAYRESSNGPRKSYPGGPATYQLGVAKSADSWMVTSLGQLAS